MGLIKTKKPNQPATNQGAQSEEERAPVKKPSDKASKFAELAQTLSVQPDEPLVPKEALDTVRMPLSQIHFDGNNARTMHFNLARPTENPLDPDHPEYESVQSTLEGVLSLADHLKQEPLRQEYALYRDRGRFFVAYGHRRHLALLIAFGPSHTRTFRVYPSRPDNLARTRWIENAAREGVPLQQRLVDFKAALDEISRPDLSQNALAAELGINKATLSILKRAVENEAILDAVQQGRVRRQDQLAELVKANPKTVEEVVELLTSKDDTLALATKPRKVEASANERGRPRTTLRFKPIQNPLVFRELVNGALAKFEWTEEDFSSMERMQAKLDDCLELLEKRIGKAKT